MWHVKLLPIFQMLKARADANSTAASQRLPLGLSAAERLQQLQQEALQEDASRQSPTSVSSSAGSSSTDWTHQKYPYRKVGSVESVAIRRNNFLAEVNRVDSPRMMLFNGNTMVDATGRGTPTFGLHSLHISFSIFRALKSPSFENDLNFGQIVINAPLKSTNAKVQTNMHCESEEDVKLKGCGRFPTSSDPHHHKQQNQHQIDVGIVKNVKRHSNGNEKQSQQSEFIIIAEPKRNRSPDAVFRRNPKKNSF